MQAPEGGNKMLRGMLPVVRLILFVLSVGAAFGQDKVPAAFSVTSDAEVASKYVWRGQRLTNDWSLQPSATIARKGFSFGIWGSMDLTAVNEGDSLFLPQNPAAAPGTHRGLQGHFSEVDYTFGYSHSSSLGSLTAGTVLYTFPDRGASLCSTSEAYAGFTFENTLLRPGLTLFADLDESRKAGDTGLYLQIDASHSLPVQNRVFGGIDLSASLGIAGRGFSNYYYEVSHSGFHDVGFRATAPLKLSEQWSAGFFLAYSALLGDFRQLQYPDMREFYRQGRLTGKPDTFYGGVNISLAF
jgi:hypothetical protein